MKLNIGVSTICEFLHEQGFSRQKLQLVAKQRDDIQREIFSSEVKNYNTDQFIFLDETGCDRRDVLRRYAYSWRGIVYMHSYHISTLITILTLRS